MSTISPTPSTPGDSGTQATSSRTANQIRESFFEFFRSKGHLIVPSSPVVPANDPTLLFTNAGMNPFKPIFLGEEEGVSEGGRLWKRVADTQKCIRVSGKHNDLEEVGIDTYHHTLFEMLGNWSFGDYFKKEAIEWAWELLVDEWGLEPGRLYATVFGGDAADGLPADEEAERLWAERTSIPKDHILRFGRKDNFWEMGDTGPCGPCSEIHVDLRTDQERAATPGATLVNAGDPRVMEIWNLVFIQFERVAGGALKPLPAQHVDTGMGFERICAVMQGKRSNYDSDVFSGLIGEIGRIAGRAYGDDEAVDIAMRVIADHVRAVSFSIADGASPSNEGRGYVVRRILRRAIRYGWDRLELREPFIHRLVPYLAGQFAGVFPELEAQKGFVADIIAAEERSFIKTLGQGIELFAGASKGVTVISGEDAFRLHDTYGFPIDLTQLMARERGLDVDIAGFERLMTAQRERARAAGKFASGQGSMTWRPVPGAGDGDGDRGAKGGAQGGAQGGAGFEFVGYDELAVDVRIVATAEVAAAGSAGGGAESGGAMATAAGSGAAGKGDGASKTRRLLLLDRSPFYAESGGQTSDTGTLRQGDQVIRVLDVQKGGDGFVHEVDRLPSDPTGAWRAEVDVDRRMETRRHHSAAHLLHAALRQVLGTHVVQKGSLVTVDKVRFDFSHHQAVSPDELRRIERIVNERIRQNITLMEERDVPIAEARERGAMMLFGEKYGESVRMITFDPDFSMELCAGTHAEATGEIGYFRIVSESSVAAGIRRIEGVVGRRADDLLHGEMELLQSIQRLLAHPKDLAGDLQKLIDEKRDLEERLRRLQQERHLSSLDAILQKGRKAVIGPDGGMSFHLFVGEVKGADMDGLKQLGYEALRRHSTETAVLLASADAETGKVAVMAALSEDLVKAGLHAGTWVKKLSAVVGGGGGGQPGLATAGGRDASALPAMLDRAEELLRA